MGYIVYNKDVKMFDICEFLIIVIYCKKKIDNCLIIRVCVGLDV